MEIQSDNDKLNKHIIPKDEAIGFVDENKSLFDEWLNSDLESINAVERKKDNKVRELTEKLKAFHDDIQQAIDNGVTDIKELLDIIDGKRDNGDDDELEEDLRVLHSQAYYKAYQAEIEARKTSRLKQMTCFEDQLPLILAKTLEEF